MGLKVLGISASPRQRGNSDLLLRRALQGAESAGAEVEYVRLADLSIGSCIECNWCYGTGRCKIEDDYQVVLEKMLAADRVIFATPIFFMTVCSQAKALIDRCQCLWAHKAVLGREIAETSGRDRRAMVIAVGGSKSRKMFESVRLTMKSFFDVLDLQYVGGLFVNQVNDPGEIEKKRSILDEAHRLGRDLAGTGTPPDEPEDIELV